MIKNIFLLILIFLISPLFCQEINQYEPELITIITSGKDNGQIAYDKYGLPHHTRSFGISKDTNFYISDPYNSRIVIFDQNFTFLRNFKINDIQRMRIYFADKIMCDDNNNLIIMEHTVGIYKLDKQGDIFYFLKKDDLSHSVLSLDHFYSFGDNIIFYNSEKQLSIVDANGIITTPSVNQFLKDTNIAKSNTSLDNKIYNYLITENSLYYDNKIFPKDYYDFNSLRKATKNEIKALKKKSGVLKNDILVDPDIFTSQLLIGYDNDNNIYWQGYWKNLNFENKAIAIFSKDLVLLDIFTYYIDKEDVYEAIAPNGDIYIMQPKPDGVYFYKITRRW